MDDEDWDSEIKTDRPTNSYVDSTQSSSFKSSTDSSNRGSFFGRGRLVNSYSNKNTYNSDTRSSNSSNYQSSGFNQNRSSFQSNSNSYSNNNSNSYSNNSNNNYSRKSEFDDRQSSDQFDRNNNTSSNITELMTIESKMISSLIGKSGATISNIREKCFVKIFVPQREEIQDKFETDIKIIGSSRDNIEKAKDMIKQIIEQSSSSSYSSYGQRNENFSSNRSEPVKRNYPYESSGTNRSEDTNSYRDTKMSFSSSRHETKYSKDETDNKEDKMDVNESSKPTSGGFTGGIDWDLIRSQPLQNLNKFKDHPPVIKDFYVEDPEITKMTREEVKEFRKNNFNIIVELFKKEKISYSLNAKADEDTRTPEEIEDYLFEKIPKPVKTIHNAFSNYPGIIDECNRQNFINPTPIQAQLWPILLKGLDCVGIAQTGTGKTLAFLLPALIHIDNQITPRAKRVGPNVLVLSPTRELAIQIEQEVKKINYKGIKSVCVYGGGDRKEQANVCTQGVEIIIATPGRLYDYIQSGIVNVTSVTYLVLDEADRMLDMGFEPQIMKILLDIRPDRQTVMTSATWPEGVRRLATKYLNEPIQLYVGSLDLRAAKTVTQLLEMVRSEDEKRERLMHLIEHEMDENDKLIVFVGRKALADNLSCDLALKNIQCQSIHGDRAQCDREEALEEFKDGTVRILIATDVASRGIDVKDITCVVNYDFPRNIEEYVHRVGRTGRAGRTGKSITFVAREDWKHAKELIEILKQGEQEVPQSLIDMAERYEAMQKKKQEENASGVRRGGGRFNNRDDHGGFGGHGGHSGGDSGFKRSSGEEGSNRPFMPRGRRGRGGGKRDDTFGFVF